MKNAKQPFIHDQRSSAENEKPHEKNPHAAIASSPLDQNAQRLQQKVKDHRSKTFSTCDNVKRHVDHRFVKNTRCQKNQEKCEHGTGSQRGKNDLAKPVTHPHVPTAAPELRNTFCQRWR